MSKSFDVEIGISIAIVLILTVLIAGFAVSTTGLAEDDKVETYELSVEDSTETVEEVYLYENLSTYDQSKVDSLTDADSLTVENPPDNSIISTPSDNSVSVVQENGEEVRFDVENQSPIHIPLILSFISGVAALGFAALASTERQDPTYLLVTAGLLALMYWI